MTATGRTNIVRRHGRHLRDLLGIVDHPSFHAYLLGHGLARYAALARTEGRSLGAALALCANEREALALQALPFERIVLTGLQPPRPQLQDLVRADGRMTYARQNAERLSLDAQTFDLVLCKEGLHHLARPIQGLYEMLRLSRFAVLLIEPADSWVHRLLGPWGITSTFERAQDGNVGGRDNHVYRFTVAGLRALFDSYYLDSGYDLDVTLGWVTSRLNAHPSFWVRTAAALAGQLGGWLPGARGNYLTALLRIGRDLPP